MKKLFSLTVSMCCVITGFVFITTCSTNQKKLTPREGYIHVNGGKIWYKIVGEGNKTPLLLLHGGPAIPSYYLNPIGELSKDRPIIFYDQLGCGRSDRVTDTTLMSIDHFVEELKQVHDSLGLKDFYLYGHSWGTMLGTDFYLKYPAGIKAMILASPALSMTRWMQDADTLIKTLPDSVQNAIHVNEENKTYDAPSYQQAVQIFYEHFVARKLPWSADIDSSISQAGMNVYQYMNGPSEFTVTGQLKNYDRTNRLSEIKVPVLFIAGEYDEALPSTV